MEADDMRSQVHGSPSVESVEIPEDVSSALDELPHRNASRKMELEPWVDLVLVKYWKVKRKADIAKMLGISEGVLRRRAEELEI